MNRSNIWSSPNVFLNYPSTYPRVHIAMPHRTRSVHRSFAHNAAERVIVTSESFLPVWSVLFWLRMPRLDNARNFTWKITDFDVDHLLPITTRWSVYRLSYRYQNRSSPARMSSMRFILMPSECTGKNRHRRSHLFFSIKDAVWRFILNEQNTPDDHLHSVMN